MTEPTDAELKAMWQLHAADIGGIFYYARAVLAKWGQPAQAAEPVAVVVPCYTPSGKRVALYSAKQDLPIGTQLYTAPQPTQATAAQQGVAYAALPEPYCNAHDDADACYPDMFSEQQMRAFADATCALRASHGQAPAGAEQ